jgi:small acid-soluble spore protein H (minor)
VWIESIEDTSSMAVVSERGTHSERQLVSIDALEETGEYYT